MDEATTREMEANEDHNEEQSWQLPDTPLHLRTKLAFAVVTALGGMLLGTGADTGSLAVIVVAFAIIGFVCVDWQKLFALPAVVAYAAMAITGMVCVADFVKDANLLGRKMAAVAQLLAVAQAILMLQEKTHRLFEQLLIFALLNCVVAAVFNDAFSYAIWFFPLTLATGLALALLAADETVTDADHARHEKTSRTGEQTRAAMFTVDNQAAVASFSRVAMQLSWTSLFVLIPAVSLIAGSIFFALPRRMEAQRGASAEALVGYSDSVRLGQIGQMQLSQDRALRVSLYDPEAKRPYPVVDSIYLRGRSLERYLADVEISNGGGSWESLALRVEGRVQPLPARFVPDRTSDQNFYDRVDVEVQCEAMRSEALFAIAPYHRIIGSEQIAHRPFQWVISRKSNAASAYRVLQFSRIDYKFGTHAFRDGVQSPWIADLSLASEVEDFDEEPIDTNALTADQLEYLDSLLEYPEQAIPSAQAIANDIVKSIARRKRNPVAIAQRLEQHLAMSTQFRYTLDLDAKIVLGMDPIEQFLSIDRRGHCQYFASALAMMLRSQGIPARLVVGYHCDEFNELGQYFVVRQSHAHAWVEALIDRDDLPIGQSVYGQPESQRYWLRLDPTPGGGGLIEGDQVGSGRQIAELAQSFWNDYVVEMNPQTQRSTLLAAPGFAPMTNSYRSWIERAKNLALRINSGELGGANGSRMFSLPAAIVAILGCVTLLMFLKMRFPAWYRRRRENQFTKAPRPSLPFYAEALELLEQMGYCRTAGQTPAELTASLRQAELRQPTSVLTQLFYRIRYGGETINSSTPPVNEWSDNAQNLDDQDSINRSLDGLRRQVSLHSSHTNNKK
jgi:hypothetical protein